ncbi:MAG: DUF2914 domain-containing protein [Desulfobacteraceae bacterium]|jgi:hypothetical protein
MPQKNRINLYDNRSIAFSSFHIKMKMLVMCLTVAMVLSNIVCLAENTPPQAKMPPPVLKRAVLCEKVLNSTTPINESVVFSSSIGKLICFTDFDPVYEETSIYHKFYFKDKLSSRFTLTLKPPRWATQSSIQIRGESDKGPWRVEITDAEGNILSTIRFSITD